MRTGARARFLVIWGLVVTASSLVSATSFAQGTGDAGADPKPTTEPVLRVSRTPDVAPGTNPGRDSHPLDPALRLAYDGLASMQRQVHDYTATLVKRERVDGSLQDEEHMHVKIRNARNVPGQGQVPKVLGWRQSAGSSMTESSKPRPNIGQGLRIPFVDPGQGWITKRCVYVRSPAVNCTKYMPAARSPFRSTTVLRFPPCVAMVRATMRLPLRSNRSMLTVVTPSSMALMLMKSWSPRFGLGHMFNEALETGVSIALFCWPPLN